MKHHEPSSPFENLKAVNVSLQFFPGAHASLSVRQCFLCLNKLFDIIEIDEEFCLFTPFE